jgi:two-component system OmpR family response regulator
MTGLKLLYVEDEPDIRTITCLTLGNIGGHEVLEAASGPEALNILKSETPDMILLDVMMPMMNGPETFRRIREMPSGQNIPVVFMTAKVQTREIEEYLKMGAIGVIAKPFDPMTLCQKINDLWQATQAPSKKAG